MHTQQVKKLPSIMSGRTSSICDQTRGNIRRKAVESGLRKRLHIANQEKKATHETGLNTAKCKCCCAREKFATRAHCERLNAVFDRPPMG